MSTARTFLNVFNVAFTAICVTSALAFFSGYEHGLRGLRCASSSAPMQLSSRVALATALSFGAGAASGAIGALVAVSRHHARPKRDNDDRGGGEPEPDVIGTVLMLGTVTTVLATLFVMSGEKEGASSVWPFSSTYRTFLNVFNVAFTAICVTSALAFFSGYEHGLRGLRGRGGAIGIHQAAVHGIVGGGLVAAWTARQR
ncbi:hypothetical protein Rsub_08813 [Raphidocelis subcapitata]|uniref:Uncharacterized protein n=1 Tax=Raphidocelis subcapitata TaxID=307507 RepID=A0A2V0P806_9CHLO|nr:hypothetical protein Rsub_08813 [Raphidocelis subcapitata]|eukprot:GBF95998.1 hypothetical protein Rsub_08813 [Raphidocelis subcapitata]